MVKEGWKEEKLGNVIELKYGKGLPKRARKKGKFPVYGSGGIVDNHNKSMIKGPGIIVGRKGNVGSVYYSKEDFFPIDTVFYIENNPNKYNLKFVYYMLKNSTSIKLSSDAAVPGLNRNYALSREFTIPEDIDEQQKIATILSNYDDLIENNTKRIQLLEKIAKLVYDEWFVKFKFPEHKKVKMVGSELGKIPEGWRVKKVSKICNVVIRGVTPKYENDSGRYIINQKVNKGNYLDYQYLKELKKYLDVPEEKFAYKGDVLINSLGEGTIGRVHYYNGPDKVYAIDQHMSICRSNNKEQTLYLYFWLSSNKGQKWINSVKTGGTNMTMLNISTLRDYNLAIPKEEILEIFYSQIKRIFDLRTKLDVKNQNLRKTRDLLLLKLISGQVDVSDLDIKVSEVGG